MEKNIKEGLIKWNDKRYNCCLESTCNYFFKFYLERSLVMNESEMDKLPKTDAEKDELRKKKIELNESEPKKPTDKRIIKLYDPSDYYLKD